MKRHLFSVTVIVGTLLWFPPIKAKQFDVTLLGGVKYSDQLQLAIPENYITLKIDAKDGVRGGVTIGVYLPDMSPERSFSAQQRRKAAPDFASITLSYEPREDLAEVEWASKQSQRKAPPIRTNVEAGFEEYEASKSVPPRSFFWWSNEHAYAECFAVAPRCNVRAYILEGVYAQMVIDKAHLLQVGAIRNKVKVLVESFNPRCLRASGVRGQCTGAQPSLPGDVPASAALPLRPGRA